ncbi:matrix metalloproteinase-16-like [Pseudomyrmex gracilis]|uniref:matrix metalloproteinase-16-like n=1 Tax=Pseudomyrmex gracilis TaxID=219809 RepID=UPI0009951F50|nr:matrix metalloproteinase-16-like [Pseudomyrmex gracilis]
MTSLVLPLTFLTLLVASTTATAIASTSSMMNTTTTTKRNVVNGRENAIAFLRKYGYLKDDVDNSLICESALSHAVSLFQEFYDLPIDGELNVETMRAVNRPRCGQDIETRHSNKEHIYKWSTNHLT